MTARSEWRARRARVPASSSSWAEGRLPSGARAAEAALAVGGVGQPLDLDEARVRHGLDQQMGDAFSALDGDRFGAVVDQQDLELAAVARVDEPRRIEHRDTFVHGQARSSELVSPQVAKRLATPGHLNGPVCAVFVLNASPAS